MTVFLSCVSTEFPSLRTNLAWGVRRSSLKVLHQEEFVNQGLLTLHLLEAEIVKSKHVFHVLGETSGAPAPKGQVEDFLRRHPHFG
jgi:hypothetical protein